MGGPLQPLVGCVLAQQTITTRHQLFKGTRFLRDLQINNKNTTPRIKKVIVLEPQRLALNSTRSRG